MGEVDLSPDTVTAAWVHDVECAYSWHDSMMKLVMSDFGNEARLIRGGNIAVRFATGGIVGARNMAAAQFLERDHPWLWWIDTDMGFAPDTVERLLEVADPVERPVVGAMCFSQRELRVDDMGGFVTAPMPTLYQWHEVTDGRAGFVPWVEYPRDAVAQVAGTGSACILIHRSVFERIADEEGPNWYTPVRHPTLGEISEDLSFCMRMSRYGIPLHVHTGVKTTHLKPQWVNEATFDVFYEHAKSGAPQLNRAERRRKAKAG